MGIQWARSAAIALLCGAGAALAIPASTAAGPELGAVSGKTDRGSILVYLEGVAVPLPEPPAAHPVISQKGLTFAPEVTVVLKGTTIDFPNDDKVFHNVFSLSQPAKFDLGLYKSGDTKSVQFNRPGVVDLYCNIHPQMAAKIKVLDTRYFAVSAADGSFLIPNVPPGTYNLVGWQPYGDAANVSVTIEAGRTASTSLTIPPAQGRQKSHVRKDGTPYGRYQ